VITLYHNPACSNSRACLAILQETGADLRILDYLKAPLSVTELTALAQSLKATAGEGWTVRDMMRVKEPAYAGLESADDGALLAAIAAHPILLNRPIVVRESEDGSAPAQARLCRPPELVREML
jgi:arsenate reductase (glutaredoxin)